MLGPFSPNPEILHGFPRVQLQVSAWWHFLHDRFCVCACVGKERGFKYHSTSLTLQMRGLRQGEILVTSLGSNSPFPLSCCLFLAFLPTFSSRGHQSGWPGASAGTKLSPSVPSTRAVWTRAWATGTALPIKNWLQWVLLGHEIASPRSLIKRKVK